VVDPGDARRSWRRSAHGLTLTAILLTHHHADHIGGVPELLARFPMCRYSARATTASMLVTHPLGEGDRVTVPGLALELDVLEVPGHTLGHIAYVRRTPGLHWLFCGDTLFAGGCGRLFEGTPAQMAGLARQAGSLPEDTEVYCAHEYTVSNLRFAQAVEPDNEALALRMRDENAKRAAGLPTVPSSIGWSAVRIRSCGIASRRSWVPGCGRQAGTMGRRRCRRLRPCGNGRTCSERVRWPEGRG
jgi:hydroxyacylglutathione hydrolase